MSANTTRAVRNQLNTQTTKMWSEDVKQLVALLQENFQAGEMIKDPAEYVAKYRWSIKAAGPELTFLQLATPDKSSPFGWKPTPLLMEFVAKRKTAKKMRRLYQANMWWQYLADYVFGYRSDRTEGSKFTYELLVAVGLMHEDDGDGWVTEDLHNLFDNGYAARRLHDKLPFLALPSAGPYEVVLQPRS